MLADYFMKPLQGSLFTKFRHVIMGYEHISTLKHPSLAPSEEHPSLAPSEERVGNQGSEKVKMHMGQMDRQTRY